MPRLTNPQLSPDGRQILYELAAADWKADKRVSHVWRVGVDGSGTVQMTDGAGEQGARWSPDGQTIVYVGKRTGEEAQIYQMSNSGGEGRPLTRHASSVSRLSWAPDGRDLFFVAPDPKTPEELQRDRPKRRVRLRRNFRQLPRKFNWRPRGNAADDGRFQSRISAHRTARRSCSTTRRILLGSRARRSLAHVSDRSNATDEERRSENGAGLPDNSRSSSLRRPTNSSTRTTARFSSSRRRQPGHVVSRPATVHVEKARPVVEGRQVDRLAGEHGHARDLRDAILWRSLHQLTDGKHALTGWSMDSGRQVFTLEEPTNPATCGC